MDEVEVQQKRREHDEQATQQRAAILGLQYLDLRDIEADLPLAMNVMPVDDMHKNRMVPLVKGDSDTVYQFGVTSQTPQSVMDKMRAEYNEDGRSLQFNLISGGGFKAMMDRFDPPKKVIYDDITIAKEGDSETIAQVSQTLNSVGSEAIFNFLVQQADKLNASDIHIENMRENIRIRMRVDGALHPVAHIDRDKYRIIQGELASRAGVSTAQPKTTNKRG